MKYYNKSDYSYTSLFCEENSWLLIKSLTTEGISIDNIRVIFITNKSKQIAIFNQLSANIGEAVIWDYHVILAVTIDKVETIFDFDSRLPFPCKIEHYLKSSFLENIKPQYISQFRVIAANQYLRQFYSDRSHMVGVISESQFPQYPTICSNTKFKIYLQDLVDINKPIKETVTLAKRNLLFNIDRLNNNI